MMDFGTLGSEPSLLSLNKMLIERNDKKVTNKVTSIYLIAKENLAKLDKYVKDQDLAFYNRLLHVLRSDCLEKVDLQKDRLEKDIYTHLRCAIVGLYRQAEREVRAANQENIRRRKQGQKRL